MAVCLGVGKKIVVMSQYWKEYGYDVLSLRRTNKRGVIGVVGEVGEYKGGKECEL